MQHPLATAMALFGLLCANLACAQAPASAAGAPQAPMTAKAARQQFAEKFAAADINHDGKLTREEAQSGMPDVYAHFGEIDRKKKGYVTKKQIGQWYGLRFKEKQARQLEKSI
ncbi:hypothetical protein BJN34_12470 [Cupriavidus necator]|uniref:EF-hand domain-containing protein n=2 Tax=Cupriavidus necator TaxID=106590 RepID=A0A1U9URD6_CUPNE|nr:hypothetical protein BJN34_12470 [Cupriavidus necator]